MPRYLSDATNRSGAPRPTPKAGLTGVREEIKYLLDPDQAAGAMRRVQTHVPPKSVNGSSNSFRVSTYLDTPDLKFARSELNQPHNAIKLRAKDYYLLDGTLPVYDRICWLEVKARMGTMVEKSRFPVDRTEVLNVLNHKARPPADPKDRAAQEAFEAIRAGATLAPLFIVHYLRYTFERPDSQMRVTFDKQVSYHMAPTDLFRDGEIRTRVNLPPPLRLEPRWVVEVKTVGALPDWLDEILDPTAQHQYSKFGSGVRELHALGYIDADANESK